MKILVLVASHFRYESDHAMPLQAEEQKYATPDATNPTNTFSTERPSPHLNQRYRLRFYLCVCSFRWLHTSIQNTSTTPFDSFVPKPIAHTIRFPAYFPSLQNLPNMSLSSKLSITDVDLKGKRVLIRVSCPS